MNRNPIMPRQTVLIIGVGNEYRSDDAAGIFVARKLKALAIPELTIKEL